MRRVMTTRIPPLHFSNARPLLACPPRPTNVQGCPHFACQEGWKMKPFSQAKLKSKSCFAKRSQCSGARNAPARVMQRVTVLERLGDGFTGVVSKVRLPDGRHAALKESHANLTNTKAMTRVHLEAAMQRRAAVRWRRASRPVPLQALGPDLFRNGGWSVDRAGERLCVCGGERSEAGALVRRAVARVGHV